MTWLDPQATITRVRSSNELRRVERLLGRRDPVLRRVIKGVGPCKLDVMSGTNFQILTGTIISQQLSTKVARVIYGRLVEKLDGKKPTPQNVLALQEDDLRSVGLSRSKTSFIRGVAEAFRDGRIKPRSLAARSDEDVTAALTSIKGIGEWSADMFLIFALGRLDVFPTGDLGLRNAIRRHYGLRKPPSEKRLQQIGRMWKPYRTIGTWYLWEAYDNS